MWCYRHAAKCLGSGKIYKNTHPDIYRPPDMTGEDFGRKERSSPGNNGDVVFHHEAEHFQCFGNMDDFPPITGRIGGITQVNKRGGIGATTRIGHDALNDPYAVSGGYLAGANNLNMIARS